MTTRAQRVENFGNKHQERQTMNTPIASEYIKYLEDFQSETFRNLQDKNLVSEFLHPFVELHLDNLATNINNGMDRSDALMLAKKETTLLLDQACQEVV